MRAWGMMRSTVMLGKELVELARSFKLLWVPLVFLLLGIMQPVSTYYMPLILEKAGNMPDGTIIDIPKPLGAEVLAQTLQQFGTLGLLVLVLIAMNTVSGERNNGTASLILVKPISVLSYIGSKWLALLLLTWVSLCIGYTAAWYYTGLLIGAVPLVDMLGSLIIYALWLSFVVTITVMLSTLLRSPAAAAFSALGAAVVLAMLAGIFPEQLGWSPGALGSLAYQTVMDNLTPGGNLTAAIAAVFALTAAAIFASVMALSHSSAVE